MLCKKNLIVSFTLAALSVLAPVVLGRQLNPPVLDQAYAGAVTVSGKITPGDGPVSIYDVSTAPRIALGVSESIDKDGNFAVAVKPALISSHKIVAVDAKGNTS